MTILLQTLGSGSYSTVREAMHIESGRYYACKVISKRLMQGHEKMVSLSCSAAQLLISGARTLTRPASLRTTRLSTRSA